ncbi:MAG: DUF1648 domain-containing protein [Betaproteobacteria bacterium]|nr:DUF1648 domain-containing protein [Betaproteobacteria bacterium]MDH3436423.1 DUF1648 domain-containing protein [Betaproteobacteria bacterium]
MSRLPFHAFALLGVALLVDLALTVPSLAEPVATHFDGTGQPNGWMTRTGYAIFMVAFGIGLPSLILGLIPLISGWFPTRINIPNKQYWLAPERREETLLFLRWHLCWLATLMAFFALAIHHLILMANASRPPALPHTPFLFMLGCFLAGMAVWTVLLWRRFRKPS